MDGKETVSEVNTLGGCEWIRVQASGIHGTGVFARQVIRRGARIVEYTGERITKAESLRRCQDDNPFIFTLDDEHDLDGNVETNPARFINHSCSPNCDAEIDGGRIWVVATRDISPDEEITFNYGYDLNDYREYPCRCGCPECVGYMVAAEFFDHVRNQRALRQEVSDSA